MSNQEQPTNSVQNPSHPIYNPKCDGEASREGKVGANHHDSFTPPGFILIQPTDNKGFLTDASGATTRDIWLKVEGEILKAAIEENGGQEIKLCDYVRLEYSGDKLIKITKIDPSKK